MKSLPLLVVLALSSALVVPVTSGTAPGVADDAAELGSVGDVARLDSVGDTATLDSVGDAAASDRQHASNTTAVNATTRTRILAVPDAAVQRTEIDQATLSLGPSTRFAGNVSAVRLETAAVERYVTASDDEDEQSRRIIQAFSTVEQEVITLRGRQQSAIDAFNRGELTPKEFVIELATISARAEALEERITMLERLAGNIEGFSLSRADPLTYELRAFGGPVRERAVDAISGTEPATRFFVTTGPEGYELATITDGVYVREAFRGAVRSGDASATLSTSEAINITKRSYPVITARTDGSVTASGTTNIVTVPGANVSLTAFIDSERERVFKEYQRMSLATYKSGSSATNVLNGLRITINRTYPGGPMRIHVVDAETGEPADLTITLSQGPSEGMELGRTGDDGTLWTLSPRGSFTVTAVGEDTAATFLETNATDTPDI